MTEIVRYPYHSPYANIALDALELVKWSMRKVLPPNRRRSQLPDILKRRVIASYAQHYNLSAFVESGTYLGGTVAFMRKHCHRLYSIEFQPHLAKAAQERFTNDSAIQIFQGSGAIWMPRIVAGLREPALFWLDGHFAAGTAKDGEVACPTMEEISAVLADSRYRHVVLVDDAREFRGEGGYPTLDELRRFILTARPDATIDVRDDIVRVLLTK